MIAAGEALAAHPEVAFAAATTGSTNLYASVLCPDPAALFNYLTAKLGRRGGDRYWSALVGEVDDMIWQAVWAGFGYFQREAGYTRTGSQPNRTGG